MKRITYSMMNYNVRIKRNKQQVSDMLVSGASYDLFDFETPVYDIRSF